MKVTYDSTEDVFCIRFSDTPVVKDISYDWNVSVGYDADGQLAELTIVDLSSVLSRDTEKDETTLVLSERESRRLLELMESPTPRTERFLAAIARHREWLRDNEPSAGVDACAWMAHQASLLRSGALNDAQRDILATFFEEQVATKRLDVEAPLRRLLVDRWRLDHLASDAGVAQQMGEFQLRVREALQASPSLRETVTARLDAVWGEARMALDHSPAIIGYKVPERPETCPYTLVDLGLAEAAPNGRTEPPSSTSSGGGLSTCSSHITPVGRNLFLDLGFPPEEAERLKAESDRRLSGKSDNGP
ncbi:MAG: DUF29 family protein [Propionivibrio sp.]